MPWKSVVDWTASLSATRGMVSEPSLFWTAAFSIAAASRLTASYACAWKAEIGAVPASVLYAGRNSFV